MSVKSCWILSGPTSWDMKDFRISWMELEYIDLYGYPNLSVYLVSPGVREQLFSKFQIIEYYNVRMTFGIFTYRWCIYLLYSLTLNLIKTESVFIEKSLRKGKIFILYLILFLFVMRERLLNIL